HKPLDSGSETNARRGPAADLLDKAVVAAPARDRALRSLGRAHELPRRARVVVEPAYQGRDELVGNAVRVEITEHGREMLPARVAQRLADRRGLRERPPDRRGLRLEIVEDA